MLCKRSIAESAGIPLRRESHAFHRVVPGDISPEIVPPVPPYAGLLDDSTADHLLAVIEDDRLAGRDGALGMSENEFIVFSF